MEQISIHPSEIKKGDMLISPGTHGGHGWTAQEGARIVIDEIHAHVQCHPDGRLTTRVWSLDENIDIKFEVHRP